MRRLVLATLLVALGGAGVAGAATPTAPPPRAQLQGPVCHRASNALDRAIQIIAVMRPVSGTEAMALKFELQRRTSAYGPFTNVTGGDLGKWRHPDPSTLGQQPDDVWKLTKEVVSLPAGAYRFRVTFRWTGSDQRVLGKRERIGPVCDQP